MLGFLRSNAWRKAKPAGPPKQPPPVHLTDFVGETMGTRYQVRLATALQLNVKILADQIQMAVDAVDAQMSTWKPGSDLSRFNAAPLHEWIAVPDTLALVVETGLAISRSTNGAFDMTVGAAVNAWGFGPDGPVEALPLQRLTGKWRDLEARRAPPALQKSQPMYVDLSGIAKGYGVDRICEVLHSAGIVDYLVSIDGETRCRGRKPGLQGVWTIAVDLPADGEPQVWDVLALSDGAVATSGDYRRYFDRDGRRYSHTIDGRTGQPVQGAAASVTVMRDTCMQADAWATALLVMGPQQGVAVAQARNIAALFLFRDGDGFRSVVTGEMQTHLP